MDLRTLRTEIDRIDARIVGLLSERMERAALTRRFKAEVADGGREEAVLAGVRAKASGLASPDFVAGLYGQVMAESRRVQGLGRPLVGFQGERGAYGDAATRAWLEGVAPIPCKEFQDVFDGVAGGWLDYGLVPVENTLGGTVGQVNSILVESGLRVVGAVDLPVEHCLLALPGQDHRDIRYVYSHPQALAQCRRFLERNRLDGVSHYDTAGSARMLAEDRPRASAAIASRYAGEIYGLEIIKEGIQDAAQNRTRFFALAKGVGATTPPGRADLPKRRKCSAVFLSDDKAGTLFGMLELFARRGINLTRIESAPYRPGDYAIFLDFDGDEGEPRVAEALAEAARRAPDFRLLGCYDELRVRP